MKFNKIIVFFLFTYFLLAFPSFYFVYKFLDPIEIAHDFFQYYRLYNNWDWSNVNAPFNMRLVSSFLVFLFNKIGIYYETATAFDKYLGYGFDKCVYFNAILFNYLCVVTTSTIICISIAKTSNNKLLTFVGGLIYLLGFGTLFYELTPCTDAFSTLMFAVMIICYQNKSKWLLALIVLSILQREYLLLVFGLMALIDFIHERKKHYVIVLMACLIGFVVYFILRRTLFYTPALSFQTSPAQLMDAFTSITFPIFPFIKQTLLTLNIFMLYVALIIYKYYKGLNFDRAVLIKLSLLFIQIILISFAAVLGNNAGRYFYMLSPFIIFELVKEGSFLIGSQEKINTE